MNVDCFRPPDEWELKVLNRLLTPEFAEKGPLAEQLRRVMVSVIDENGSLELRVADGPLIRQEVLGVPTEGEAEDSDGVTIHFLLHVRDGVAKELEIYKDDLSTIRARPDPSVVRVFA